MFGELADNFACKMHLILDIYCISFLPKLSSWLLKLYNVNFRENSICQPNLLGQHISYIYCSNIQIPAKEWNKSVSTPFNPIFNCLQSLIWFISISNLCFIHCNWNMHILQNSKHWLHLILNITSFHHENSFSYFVFFDMVRKGWEVL